MKWLLALVALTAVASVGVAAKVVIDNRDPVPGDTLRCLRRSGLELARGNDALGVMRPDVAAKTLRVVRRWDWGRTAGVLIAGSRNDYVTLALWSGDSPSLATAASLVRVYDRPSAFPVVAVEAPDNGALRRCAARN